MVTPLTPILLQCHQECERMNILVGVIVRTLSELCLAYKARLITERQIRTVQYLNQLQNMIIPISLAKGEVASVSVTQVKHTPAEGLNRRCTSGSPQTHEENKIVWRMRSDHSLYVIYKYYTKTTKEWGISLPLQTLAMRYRVFQGDLTMTEQLEELQLAVSTDKVGTFIATEV